MLGRAEGRAQALLAADKLSIIRESERLCRTNKNVGLKPTFLFSMGKERQIAEKISVVNSYKRLLSFNLIRLPQLLQI